MERKFKQHVKPFKLWESENFSKRNILNEKTEYGDGNNTWTAYVQSMFDLTNGFKYDDKYTDANSKFREVYVPDMNSITIGFIIKLADTLGGNAEDLFTYIMHMLFKFNNIEPRIKDIRTTGTNFNDMWKRLKNATKLKLSDIRLEHFDNDFYLALATINDKISDKVDLWTMLTSSKKFNYFKKYDSLADESLINKYVNNKYDEFLKAYKNNEGRTLTRHFGNEFDKVVKNLQDLNLKSDGNINAISHFFDNSGKFKEQTIEYFASGIFKEKDSQNSTDTAKK